MYISKDLPDEYTGSQFTYSLKGANAKAKANASQGIPELLEIAVGKHFKENIGDKHKRNAENGWYLYDILDIIKKRATCSSHETLLGKNPFLY